MFYDEHKLEVDNDEIRLIFNTNSLELNNNSFVEIFYTVDDDDELSEINITDAIVEIQKINGSLNVGDSDNGFNITFQIDKHNRDWKIRCSEYLYRNSHVIYPHEIEINLDKKELFLTFDNIQ